MLDILLYALSVSYLTHLLLLSNKTGPFKSYIRWVLVDGKPLGEARQVNLFDWIRRPFGVYTVKDFVWELHENELWSCPACLSFRLNLVFLLPFALATDYPLITYVLLIGAAPMIAIKLNV